MQYNLLDKIRKRKKINEEQEPDIGKSVQIVKLDNNRNPILNAEALNEVFQHPDANGKPAIIISVVGNQGEGKSFILNWFLRYLRYQSAITSYSSDCETSDDNHSDEENAAYAGESYKWMGDLSKPLRGFQWKGS